MEPKTHEKNPKDVKEKKEAKRQEMPVCNYAPEWAEHARFHREDEPCDDGRMGGRPCADDEAGCPVTHDGASEGENKV